MKKILMVVGVLYGGGAERVVSIWASQLAQNGYDVSLLLLGRREKEYAIDERVKIYTIAPNYEQVKNIPYLKRLKRMRAIIKTVKPDVMINFLSKMQIWGYFASFGLKIRRIETIRNNPWIIEKTYNKAARFILKRTYIKSSAIIAQTLEQTEYFNQKTQKKCVVIPNPIAQQYKDNPKTEYSKQITHFVAAGRITPQKNYPLMIKAFQKACERNEDITLSIYGSGDEEYTQKMQSLVDETGLYSRIQLMGRTTDMPSVLRSADAFLMTSDFEGMPNALAEAMATGLVCISTNCPTGPRDLIDHGKNGYLAQVGDEKEIVSAIEKATTLTQKEAMEIGECAREKVLKLCGEDNSLKKLIDVIEG